MAAFVIAGTIRSSVIRAGRGGSGLEFFAFEKLCVKYLIRMRWQFRSAPTIAIVQLMRLLPLERAVTGGQRAKNMLGDAFHCAR